jgi:hypothetical protein
MNVRIACLAALISIVGVVATAASGCGTGDKAPGPSAKSSPAITSTPSTDRSLDTNAFKVTVSADQSTPPLTVTASNQPPPQLPDFLTGNDPGVDVAMPNGAQPNKPVTLKFDFSGKPAFGTPGTVPAVAAVSEGMTEPEVLPSQWDPSTHTLVAQTDHLSFFLPINLDLKRFGDRITNALNGFLGLSSGKPGCVGEKLVVDDTTYTLNPPTVPAAWPCLSRSGDKISVDLSANSPNGWIVRSNPVTSDQSVDLTADVAGAFDQAAYRTLFAPSVGNGTFMLPGGTTHLRFDKANPPREVMLRADPGVTLINGAFLAFHALFPSSKLWDIPDVVTCVNTLVTSNFGGDPTGAAFGNDVEGLTKCMTQATDHLRGKPIDSVATLASRSLGAVLSLGPDIASQLAANLRGFIGEFTGENTETIAVLADQHTTTTSTPSPSGAAVIDRVDVTTWAYDRTEGDTYKADNTGGKQIEVFWKSFAGSKEVRSGCKSTVRIEGPGANETKQESNCDSYDPGTFLKVHNPGVYTVTVTVQQDGQPDITAQRTVTILPHT